MPRSFNMDPDLFGLVSMCRSERTQTQSSFFFFFFLFFNGNNYRTGDLTRSRGLGILRTDSNSLVTTIPWLGIGDYITVAVHMDGRYRSLVLGCLGDLSVYHS